MITKPMNENAVVTCSCGASATLKWNETLGKAECVNPRWKFRQDFAKGGWYCGKRSHYQVITKQSWEK